MIFEEYTAVLTDCAENRDQILTAILERSRYRNIDQYIKVTADPERACTYILHATHLDALKEALKALGIVRWMDNTRETKIATIQGFPKKKQE